MATYTIRYTNRAEAKRDQVLAGPRRTAFLSAIDGLRQDPRQGATDLGDNSWAKKFSGGQIVYVIADRYITVSVIDIR
ncbi:hypothetical protein [Streptomyces lichenis]|uniref:Type II toxin-antitoxin system RelE/ParE family toxin n=1 Tax=Streptomyces lichenis TaxID=2306967 RepID=A0ABT0I8A8_9ACTN|nr:hypothetical protein [Streptomyces lichenis]MCK8677550.1 hypothetical protein [Streptomyces lichenis]